jgi:hypothetical protein
MREELRREIAEKIQASFDKARGQSPQPVKRMSEGQRLAQQEKYVELLFRSAEPEVSSNLPQLSVANYLRGKKQRYVRSVSGSR